MGRFLGTIQRNWKSGVTKFAHESTMYVYVEVCTDLISMHTRILSVESMFYKC